MADEKLTQVYVTNPITLDPGNLGYAVENTGTTPAYGAFKFSQLMFNRYKITPSVSANDLVVAVKHEDGNNPSTDRPLYFKIGNSLRACTAALSVTKADGTNWANLGSAALGGLEHDLFLYAVWNTNLATDAVDVFWSRIPYGRLYSDFSATTTNERYAAINSTAPASTDECILIGRFAATLSLTGTSHLWTVPTYTNANLYHTPVYETEWRNWTPSPTGYSSVPTNTIYQYKIIGKNLYYIIREGATGTSNLTSISMTAPFTAATLTNAIWTSQGNGTDNSVNLTSPVLSRIASASGTLDFYKDVSPALTAWTGSGTKRIAYLEGRYPIA